MSLFFPQDMRARENLTHLIPDPFGPFGKAARRRPLDSSVDKRRPARKLGEDAPRGLPKPPLPRREPSAEECPPPTLVPGSLVGDDAQPFLCPAQLAFGEPRRESKFARMAGVHIP